MSNFLGLPFEQWVKNQIDTRQTSLGKYSNIPENDLLAYSTKTPFLRLASSVDVTKFGAKDKDGNEIELNKSVYQQLDDIQGLDPSQFSGDTLARNFILQGGVVSAPQGELDVSSSFSGLQGGLNDGLSGFNGAYGWGGTQERGFVPMPGITDADITYYNNGALSKTIINVKCFSKAQFQLLDVLYLRPGYTLLLEFGWSTYLDNSGNLQSMDNFYSQPLTALLNGGSTQYELYEKIEAERELKFGNYDAIYGKITKFNWQFNPDGSYDCQIQLTAVGDVIESLKININNPKDKSTSEDQKENKKDDGKGFFASLFSSSDDVKEEEIEGQLPLIANKNKSMLHREMYDLFKACAKLVAKDNSSTSPPKFFNYILRIPDETGKPSAEANKRFPKAILAVPVEPTDDSMNESPQVYMRYGALIAFIQAKLLLYTTKPKLVPIVTFDMKFDDLDDDDNVILTIPGQFSSNPKVCLIPYTNGAAGEETLVFPETELNEVMSEIQGVFNYKNNTYLARLANVMVNINYISATLTALAPEEGGDVNLISFLQSINKGIIESLGSINSFDCRLSQNGTQIQFIEDIPQRFDNPPPVGEFTRFNVFGVKPGVNGSFIRSINLTADLSNNFATMISIGAQANSNQVSGNGTAFSNYNAGLKDRIIPEKLSSPSTEGTGGEKEPLPEVQVATNFKENIFNADSDNDKSKLLETVYGGRKWIDDNVNSLTAFNDTHANLLLGILTSQPLTGGDPVLQSPFFLPFNLSLEMDGISGIKLFQKFLMTDDILPPSYQNDNVDLQVTGVNQKIDGSAWITKLDTLSVPANKSPGTPNRPAQQQSTATQQVFSSGAGKPLPPTSVVDPPESLNPESVTRFNAMQEAYNAVFARDGEVGGMCAQWTYNLALNYVKYLNGKTISGNKLRAGGNANNNNEYYNNLTKLGYVKTVSTGISKVTLLSKLSTTTWGYGDVVAYYANDKPITGTNTHYKYGHTQIYVGSINSSKWSTSKATNYGATFVYNSRPSNNWNLLIFRAPETA